MHKGLHDSIKNILPTQRHLILVCQNYSVCLKNWPRSPELQGKEGEGNSRRGGVSVQIVGPEHFFSHPSNWPSAPPFTPSVWACAPSDHFFFICCYKKCLLCSLMVQKRRDLHTHAHWLFVPPSGSCTQWLLCSGVICTGRFRCSKSSCSFQALSFRAYLPLKWSAFWNSDISVNVISFLVNSILTQEKLTEKFFQNSNKNI